MVQGNAEALTSLGAVLAPGIPNGKDTDPHPHGFLFDGVNNASIDHPSATGGTWASGINGSDQIVGYYLRGSTYRGYLYKNGIYTDIDFPDTTNTYAYGINDSGQVVGHYNDQHVGHGHGFLYDGENFTQFDNPSGYRTYAWGINAAGQIVGSIVIKNQFNQLVDRGFIANPIVAEADSTQSIMLRAKSV
jgi:probable HAF family extracellular repeat protein